MNADTTTEIVIDSDFTNHNNELPVLRVVSISSDRTMLKLEYNSGKHFLYNFNIYGSMIQSIPYLTINHQSSIINDHPCYNQPQQQTIAGSSDDVIHTSTVTFPRMTEKHNGNNINSDGLVPLCTVLDEL